MTEEQQEAWRSRTFFLRLRSAVSIRNPSNLISCAKQLKKGSSDKKYALVTMKVLQSTGINISSDGYIPPFSPFHESSSIHQILLCI